MRNNEEVRALDTPTLLALLGVAPSTLNYWVNRGFCHPTLDAGQGRRATRFWTVEDLVVLRAIKELRQAGCSLQLIALVESRLRESMGLGLANAILYYNGKDVFVADEGVAVSLIREAGQAIFMETVLVAAFPIRPWVEQGMSSAKPVNIQVIKARRAAAQAARRAI